MQQRPGRSDNACLTCFSHLFGGEISDTSSSDPVLAVSPKPDGETVRSCKHSPLVRQGQFACSLSLIAYAPLQFFADRAHAIMPCSCAGRLYNRFLGVLPDSSALSLSHRAPAVFFLLQPNVCDNLPEAHAHCALLLSRTTLALVFALGVLFLRSGQPAHQLQAEVEPACWTSHSVSETSW